MENWLVYNHAVIPTTMPDQLPDLRPIEDGSIWRIPEEKVFLARWTTDFDCAKVTNWWYEIKDVPFDIMELNSKHRNVVKKGLKNFTVRRIDPSEYAVEMFEVAELAFSVYPAKYRPVLNRDVYIADVRGWKDRVYGAFSIETGELSGYSVVHENGRFLEQRIVKTKPQWEKQGVNAALVNGALTDCADRLADGGIYYIGERTIQHETNYPEYLERYFGFRKAYCRLHIRYNPKIEAAVRLLYPMRGLLRKLDGIGVIHKINGVLKMEEIVRENA